MVYVVKYKDKYLRFGSYGSAHLVDNPENASLYSRLKDAQRRVTDYVYIKRKELQPNELTLWTIEFTFNETQVKK